MHQFVTFVSFQSNNRIKAMRRQLDEAEEEISREKAHRRKVNDKIFLNPRKDYFIINLRHKENLMTTLSPTRANRGRSAT